MPGGFNVIPVPPIPIDTKYPEYDQHGLSNGSAFSIRCADSISVTNCNVQLERSDARPLVNYHDAVVTIEKIRNNLKQF